MNEELSYATVIGTIEEVPNGPFQIHGKIKFTGKDGKTTIKENVDVSMPTISAIREDEWQLTAL